MRILVVDDNSISREIVSLYLVKEGFDVVSASDGIEALEIFGKKGPFDVVITALDIAYLNGIELTRSLKIEDKFNTQVIILSDRDDEEEKKEALQVGADAFIVKPLTEIMVIQTIKEISRNSLARR